MHGLTTYINFQGTARDAMNFYAQALGGEVSFMNFDKNMCPEGQPVPEGVMHSELKVKGMPVLMASDLPPGMDYKPGTNYSVAIGCESEAEIQSLFSKMGEGGTVTHPLKDEFWGATFGALTDKFGVAWLFNFQKS